MFSIVLLSGMCAALHAPTDSPRLTTLKKLVVMLPAALEEEDCWCAGGSDFTTAWDVACNPPTVTLVSEGWDGICFYEDWEFCSTDSSDCATDVYDVTIPVPLAGCCALANAELWIDGQLEGAGAGFWQFQDTFPHQNDRDLRCWHPEEGGPPEASQSKIVAMFCAGAGWKTSVGLIRWCGACAGIPH